MQYYYINKYRYSSFLDLELQMVCKELIIHTMVIAVCNRIGGTTIYGFIKLHACYVYITCCTHTIHT